MVSTVVQTMTMLQATQSSATVSHAPFAHASFPAPWAEGVVTEAFP